MRNKINDNINRNFRLKENFMGGDFSDNLWIKFLDHLNSNFRLKLKHILNISKTLHNIGGINNIVSMNWQFPKRNKNKQEKTSF